MNGIDPFSPEQRSRIMSLVKSRNTRPEMIVRRAVHSMGYRYRLHQASLPGTPDLVFPAARKVIFVSGCFWHMHSCGRCRIPVRNRSYWQAKLDRNQRRDRAARRQLNRLGWSVLTVWECQLANIDQLQRRLARFLSENDSMLLSEAAGR